ncbi:MAG: hypothetical protein WA869_15225 [Alloacidobacterium sp.]|jgi:hypothetical protein
MRRFTVFVSIFALIVFSARYLPGPKHSTGYVAFAAENWTTGDCPNVGNNHGNWSWSNQDRVCELRTTTIPGASHLNVSSMNGGIQVIGEDRPDIAIEARVSAWAGSLSEAKDILRQVSIETSGDSIRDSGPRFHFGSKGYGIDYKLHVPRGLSVDLKSTNGGINIAHLDSEVAFDTTNGGVQLTDVAGDVHGQTVNGGLSVELTGDRWRGKGLNAETTNGGIVLSVPEGYSAHLETGTVNGGVVLGFPVKVNGDLSKKHLSLDLGNGGPTIHVETTNGGVSIKHEKDTQASM